MVPSQLMTEVTPSSSYTLPLAPNPVSLGGGLQPKDLHAATTLAATVPRPPRKLRRFHRPLIPIYKLLRLASCGLSPRYTVDSEQRASGNAGNGNGCTRAGHHEGSGS